MKYWFEFLKPAIVFQFPISPLAMMPFSHFQPAFAKRSREARPNTYLPAPTNWWPERVHGL